MGHVYRVRNLGGLLIVCFKENLTPQVNVASALFVVVYLCYQRIQNYPCVCQYMNYMVFFFGIIPAFWGIHQLHNLVGLFWYQT